MNEKANNKIGLDWPGRFESMQQALIVGESDDYGRDDIFDFVQNFVESSYWMGFDPVPQLQKVFPALEWEYVCLDKIAGNREAMEKGIGEMMQSSDFFWPLAGAANPEDWLVARRKISDGRWFLCGCKELVEDMRKSERLTTIAKAALRILGTSECYRNVLKEKPDVG